MQPKLLDPRMMKVSLKHKNIHPRFKLNGSFYSKTDLKAFAYDLIKEGMPFEKAIGDFLADWCDDRSILQVKTSGSTGVPKVIELQKEQMVHSAQATGSFFDLKEGDNALLCLPAAYIAGKMMLVRALVLGLELDYVAPSSTPLQNSSKAYDFCAMVPLQLENSIEAINPIKKLLVGGAPMSSDLLNMVQDKATEVYATYGMTETITHVAVKKVNHLASSSSDKHENSFVALPNVNFSSDERSCLIINAPRVSNEPVITNDLVDLISNTAFQWLGRHDHVINSGGVKLFPEQIEAKLESLINNPFFVAGLPDTNFGQRLVLIVQGELDESLFRQTIKDQHILQRFEIPKEVYTLPQFSVTETGKIRRKATLELLKR